MEGEKGIYKAILNVASNVPAIAKDARNPQQGYNYRSIDAIMNALSPLMSKAGIFSVPEVIKTTREDRLTKNGSPQVFTLIEMKYRLYASDGSYIESIVIGEGSDTGDKSSNKAMAQAYKYFLTQVFNIPTVLVDSESDHNEIGKATALNYPPPKLFPKKSPLEHLRSILPEANTTEDLLDISDRWDAKKDSMTPIEYNTGRREIDEALAKKTGEAQG